jgi:hypothetical protein
MTQYLLDGMNEFPYKYFNFNSTFGMNTLNAMKAIALSSDVQDKLYAP